LAAGAVADELASPEEEATAEKHPRDTEPLQIKDHEADPLVPALPVDFVQQVVEGGYDQGQVLGVGLVEVWFGVVDLHVLDFEYNWIIRVRALCE
jgi:hypothetical protein